MQAGMNTTLHLPFVLHAKFNRNVFTQHTAEWVYYGFGLPPYIELKSGRNPKYKMSFSNS
jgi:hypothetical protein